MWTKSRAITIHLSPQCVGYKRALTNEKLLSLLFPIGGVQWLQMTGTPMYTVNVLNIQTPKTFVVIILKFELCGSTIEQ